MDEYSLKCYYDALMAAISIEKFCENTNYDGYCDNEILAAAVERKFEIIGEALNRIKKHAPEDLLMVHDWPEIIGFRNLLAHAYDRVDDAIVWGIISRQIPSFITQLKSIEGFNQYV